MTTGQAIRKAIEKLSNKKKLSANLDAEILLSHILKKPREFLLAHPEKKLTQKQVSGFRFQVSRRLKGEPAAYITGHKEFYGLNFYVNKNVLIPRPETELMADEALKFETQNLKHAAFIDIGTGSGCIIVTLAKNLNSKFPGRAPRSGAGKIQNSKFFATDISKPALAIARKNAKLHNVHKKIKFLQGDLLEPIIKNFSKFKIQNSKLIIIANLPYLTPAQIKNSPSIKYEPKLALDAGKDGLKYYRRLFKQIKKITNYPGRAPHPRAGELRITILIEINPGQVKKIKQLIKKEFPNCQIQIKKDLRWLNRMVICSMNSRQD